ncbi:MAG: alpha-L-rhamnosidase N-terminal domain-containing protein, partial [Clostridiales bacterium]|nr:alpha-L-rhamnosidase N-terminal domain-containing protein [Clostridiales bacterium]
MKWIKPERDYGDVCPTYIKNFSVDLSCEAVLTITAFGCYEAMLNGRRVGEYVLAPGWTEKRLQVQEYDVAHLLNRGKNTIEITVGRGWYRSPLAGWRGEERDPRFDMPPGVCARLKIGDEIIETDASWQVAESAVRFSEIYDGETYDARVGECEPERVDEFDSDIKLVSQQGEEILEMERIAPVAIFTTPKNERVIDFGQNITGYVEIFLPDSTY